MEHAIVLTPSFRSFAYDVIIYSEKPITENESHVVCSDCHHKNRTPKDFDEVLSVNVNKPYFGGIFALLYPYIPLTETIPGYLFTGSELKNDNLKFTSFHGKNSSKQSFELCEHLTYC